MRQHLERLPKTEVFSANAARLAKISNLRAHLPTSLQKFGAGSRRSRKKSRGVDREHAIALVGIIAVTTREQLDNLPSSIVELSIGLVEAVKRYLQLLTW